MAVANPLMQQKADRAKKGLNILVVDPNPESRTFLKSSLRAIESIEVVRETSTPQNVVEILSESPAHVMMIEQDLGELSVFDFVKQVRSHPAGQRTRVVLMSHDLTTESRSNGMEVGILGYLSKPFDIRGIETALRDSMGKVDTNHQEILMKVRKIDFFSDFSDLELVRLLKICHTRKLSSGELLFREGDHGDRLYVLLAGKVDIVKRREEGKEVLATINPGQCFGEMAIVDSEPRSADARANGDLMVMEVNAEIIKDANDILALKIYRKLAILVTKKLRNYTQK